MRVFLAHRQLAEHLAALGVGERDLLADGEAVGNAALQRQRDRDRPEHAVGQLHLASPSPPVVVAHEAVERRVSPHAEHEEVGNLA